MAGSSSASTSSSELELELEVELVLELDEPSEEEEALLSWLSCLCVPVPGLVLELGRLPCGWLQSLEDDVFELECGDVLTCEGGHWRTEEDQRV